jgi:hypothetical protein
VHYLVPVRNIILGDRYWDRIRNPESDGGVMSSPIVVVECKTNKELPVVCYGYGKVTAEFAAAEHERKKRGKPSKVYLFKGEAWIEVVR